MRFCQKCNARWPSFGDKGQVVAGFEPAMMNIFESAEDKGFQSHGFADAMTQRSVLRLAETTALSARLHALMAEVVALFRR